MSAMTSSHMPTAPFLDTGSWSDYSAQEGEQKSSIANINAFRPASMAAGRPNLYRALGGSSVTPPSYEALLSTLSNQEIDQPDRK